MSVFIVCEIPTVPMDFTPALQFGQLEVLLSHAQSLIAPVPTIRQLREKLEKFCDDDYIIPVGDPALIGTVVAVATHMNKGRAKLLKWDRKQRKYISIQIDVSGRMQ